MALFRLLLSTAQFERNRVDYHSVHCWHIARSRQCTCEDASLRSIYLDNYQAFFRYSTIIRHTKSQLLSDEQDGVARDSLAALEFFLSLSETSLRATELSSFILV